MSKKELQHYQHNINSLADRGKSGWTKKRTLVQHGKGFLGIMLRPILGGLAELVYGLLCIVSNMDFDAKSSPQHWRLQDILLYLNNKSKRDRTEKILHSILTSGDILTWNPQKEMVYHGRNIPNTNIIDLLDYTLLPYEAQISEPRGFDLFIKGLAEVMINKR